MRNESDTTTGSADDCSTKEAQVEEAIAALRAHRTGMKLGGLDWKELRDGGRR